MYYAKCIAKFLESSDTNMSYKLWISSSEWTIYASNAFKLFFTWLAGETS